MNTYFQILLVLFAVVESGLGELLGLDILLSQAWGAEAQQVSPCADPHTQQAINACAEQEYQEADTALNVVYRQLLGKLGNERKAQLKAAQRAWLKFRDAHCTFDSTQYGEGSMKPTLYYGCLTTLTRARTEELQKHLEHSLAN